MTPPPDPVGSSYAAAGGKNDDIFIDGRRKSSYPTFPNLPQLVHEKENAQHLSALLPILQKHNCLQFDNITRRRSPWVKAYCDLYHPSGPWAKFSNAPSITAKAKYNFKSYKIANIYRHLSQYDGDDPIHRELYQALHEYYEKETYYKQYMAASEQICMQQMNRPIAGRAPLPTALTTATLVAATATATTDHSTDPGNGNDDGLADADTDHHEDQSPAENYEADTPFANDPTSTNQKENQENLSTSDSNKPETEVAAKTPTTSPRGTIKPSKKTVDERQPDLDDVLASTEELFAQITDMNTINITYFIKRLQTKFNVKEFDSSLRKAARRRLVELMMTTEQEKEEEEKEDNDDDDDDTNNADGDAEGQDEIWDIIEVLTGKNTEHKCRMDCCKAMAVAIWKTNLAPDDDVWPICELCQEKEFGGWPEGILPSSSMPPLKQQPQPDDSHLELAAAAHDDEVEDNDKPKNKTSPDSSSSNKRPRDDDDDDDDDAAVDNANEDDALLKRSSRRPVSRRRREQEEDSQEELHDALLLGTPTETVNDEQESGGSSAAASVPEMATTTATPATGVPQAFTVSPEPPSTSVPVVKVGATATRNAASAIATVQDTAAQKRKIKAQQDELLELLNARRARISDDDDKDAKCQQIRAKIDELDDILFNLITA